MRAAPLSPSLQSQALSPVAVLQQPDDLFDIFAKYAEDSLGNTIKCLKLSYYTVDWLRYVPEKFSERSWEIFNFIHTQAKSARQTLAMVALVSKINGVRHSISQYFRANRGEDGFFAAANVIAKTASMYLTIYNITSLFKKLFAITAETFRWIMRGNFIALMLYPGHCLCKEIHSIAKSRFAAARSPQERANEGRKITYHVINLCSYGAEFTGGALGLGAEILGVTLAPWVSLACLSGGTALSVISYFYEQIADPYQKNRPAPAAARA